MSAKHPIIAVTGSSGAGTTSVMRTFEQIFRRESIAAGFIEGDSFHRYDRAEMKQRLATAIERGDHVFSHFGPDANLFPDLEQLFKDYGQRGTGRFRKYLHDDIEAARYKQQPGTFTEWEDLPPDTDLLFYEGLHGAVVTDEVNIARHVDLLIGVTPVVNLEWIQKLHRDKSTRGYSAEAVTDVILRRMHDYVHYICPQFSRTHINFQRVPVVDTSTPRGIDFPYLLSMLHDSFMSRANTIVCPGGKMDLAMQLIFTPMIWRLMECRKEQLARGSQVMRR